jgi:hypothetical protein
MEVGTVIVTLLQGVTAAGSRIYPQILPQDVTYPAISYTEVSAIRTHAMGTDSPVVRVRVQVDAWAVTYADSRAVANQVATALSRYRGQVGSVIVRDVLLDNEDSSYEAESQTRRVSQDYTFYISNS